MKNVSLGQKIKELRSRQGFSQDQLADQTKLSLRTIQRIENNETDPRGETLNRLATVLNLSTHELFDWTEKEDNTYLVLINLSALSFLLFPILGILMPLAVWMFKRDKIKYMNETGRYLINFQITWCLMLLIVFLWLIGDFVLRLDLFTSIGSLKIGILFFYVLYGINLVLILINTVRIAKSKKVFYQPAIPFLR